MGLSFLKIKNLEKAISSGLFMIFLGSVTGPALGNGKKIGCGTQENEGQIQENPAPVASAAPVRADDLETQESQQIRDFDSESANKIQISEEKKCPQDSIFLNLAQELRNFNINILNKLKILDVPQIHSFVSPVVVNEGEPKKIQDKNILLQNCSFASTFVVNEDEPKEVQDEINNMMKDLCYGFDKRNEEKRCVPDLEKYFANELFQQIKKIIYINKKYPLLFKINILEDNFKDFLHKVNYVISQKKIEKNFPFIVKIHKIEKEKNFLSVFYEVFLGMNIPAFLKNLNTIIFQDVEISNSESFQRQFSFSAFPLIKQKFEDNPEDFQDDIKAFFREFYRSWEKVNVGKEKKLLTSSGQDERTKIYKKTPIFRDLESDCVVCMRNEIEEIGSHFDFLDLRYNTFIKILHIKNLFLKIFSSV